MHAFTTAAALAAVAAIPAVSAHGYVSGIIANGKYTQNTSPGWYYDTTKPDTPGWYALDQDNGYVAPTSYTDGDITCHKSATPGKTFVTVAAGSEMKLEWSTWPDSHHGPVLNYLARCPGDCTAVDKSTLKFFKIAAGGLVSDTTVPGTWASDTLIANNNTATLTIPADLAPGHFVLRHEIIALHGAESEGGAQNYPQCINIQVTGSGTTYPCRSGADCRLGTKLYTETEAGILVNIYTTLSSYTIPGPKIWTGLTKRVAQVFKA